MKIDLDVIIYICGMVVTVGGAIGIISQYIKKLTNTLVREISQQVVDERVAEIRKDFDTFDQRLDEMKQYLAVYTESQESEFKLIKKALLAMTRERINSAHDYYMSKKVIGAHSLFIIEELYKSYKDLGGNSFIDRLMKDIRELEVTSVEAIDTDDLEQD